MESNASVEITAASSSPSGGMTLLPPPRIKKGMEESMEVFMARKRDSTFFGMMKSSALPPAFIVVLDPMSSCSRMDPENPVLLIFSVNSCNFNIVSIIIESLKIAILEVPAG